MGVQGRDVRDEGCGDGRVWGCEGDVAMFWVEKYEIEKEKERREHQYSKTHR